MKEIETGTTYEATLRVTQDNIAAHFVPGTPEAFATPALVALIELTAAQMLADFLEPGETTVGTSLNIRHSAPTPVGLTIRCQVILVEVDRRRLRFEIAAWDDVEKICDGEHERFVVRYDRFTANLNNKL